MNEAITLDEQFYLRIRGKVQGPFDRRKLQLLARRGRFSRSHEISTDGKTWSRAAEFPELFPAPPRKLRRPASMSHEQPNTHEGDSTAETSSDGDGAESGATVVAATYDQPWFYTQDWQECGPESFSELQVLAASGQLSPEDLVWTDGMQNWVEAHRVPGLFEQTPDGWDAVPVVGKGAVGKLEVPDPDADSTDPAGTVRAAPMAVASLVLGLLGTNVLFFLGSLLAVVFGHVALRQVRQGKGAITGRGMALTGLILGYVVLIAVTVAAIVILFVYVMYGKLPEVISP